ncbi:MAG: hypothetical protein LBL82_03695 [Oscillospiraceae bacterium]|jgi:hypothetical protein|nr:hypothetical protein [Oscillospiraceae bacterium]
MLEIHPIKDEAEIEALKKKYEDSFISHDAVFLRSEELGEPTGICAFKIHSGEDMEIELLDTEDKIAGDLLIRAAISYGENRGVANCTALHSDNDSIFVGVGFESGEEKLFINVSKVIHYRRNDKW